MRKIFPIFAVLFFGCIFSFAQARDVRQIKIISTWGGLGTPQKSELLITRKPKGYYAKGDRIENQKIDELLTAIDAPEIKGFQAANLGITQDWLEANAEPGVKEYAAYYFSTAALNQKELYLSTFKNLQTIEKILPGVLRGGWTDDHPSFTAEITRRKQIGPYLKRPADVYAALENRKKRAAGANLQRRYFPRLGHLAAEKIHQPGEIVRRGSSPRFGCVHHALYRAGLGTSRSGKQSGRYFEYFEERLRKHFRRDKSLSRSRFRRTP